MVSTVYIQEVGRHTNFKFDKSSRQFLTTLNNCSWYHNYFLDLDYDCWGAAETALIRKHTWFYNVSRFETHIVISPRLFYKVIFSTITHMWVETIFWEREDVVSAATNTYNKTIYIDMLLLMIITVVFFITHFLSTV